MYKVQTIHINGFEKVKGETQIKLGKIETSYYWNRVKAERVIEANRVAADLTGDIITCWRKISIKQRITEILDKEKNTIELEGIGTLKYKGDGLFVEI